MTPNLSRAEVLLAQARPADAEREARLALGEAPGDPFALALLARAIADQNRAGEALEPARAALAAAPDLAYFHSVLAHILHRADRPKEALAAADAALRLDPGDHTLHATRGAIRLGLRDWAGALEDSEAALRIQATDTYAQNLRATALRQLGRAADAAAVGARTLAQAPNDALSHATQGWTQLHRGDPARAQEHFREALRLEPELDEARAGMLEALKARNPVYRGFLAYALWMGRQARGVQWAFVIVTLFGQRAARSLAEASPGLGLVLWPALIVFYLAVYLTWTAVPLFNLLLRLDRFGRLVLSREERRGSSLFGATLVPVVASVVWWVLDPGAASFKAILVSAMLSVVVAVLVMRQRSDSRFLLGLGAGALALVAVCAVVLTLAGAGAGNVFFGIFFLGFLGFQLAANALRD